MSLLKRLRNRFKPDLNERGNMLVWYVFMTPVFLGAVGLAIDASLMASTASSLQTSLDAATQGTVSLSKNQASGKPRLSTTEARNSLIRLYDANRSGMYSDRSNSEGIPFLICQNSGANTVRGSASNCGFKLTEFRYSPNGGLSNGGYLTVTVQEKADTIFLQVLGFNDLTYTVTSTSRLTNSFN